MEASSVVPCTSLLPSHGDMHSTNQCMLCNIVHVRFACMSVTNLHQEAARVRRKSKKARPGLGNVGGVNGGRFGECMYCTYIHEREISTLKR
jgi:hypothetical protein